MPRKNPNVPALRPGVKVRTDFLQNEEDIVRTVIAVSKNRFGKLVVSVDGGEDKPACPTCGRVPDRGTPLGPIDSSWFFVVGD